MRQGNSLYNHDMPFYASCSAAYKQIVPVPGVPQTYFDSTGNVDYLP